MKPNKNKKFWEREIPFLKFKYKEILGAIIGYIIGAIIVYISIRLFGLLQHLL